MGLNPQGKESAQVNDADTEQAQHIAELLEIAGATKINAAVELRVAAMKVKEKAKITSLATAARRASAAAAARGEHKAMEGGIATVVAASKLKARAKVFFRLLLEPVISFVFSFQLEAACACSAQTPGISHVLTVAAPTHPVRLPRKKRRQQWQISSPTISLAKCTGHRQGPCVGCSNAGCSWIYGNGTRSNLRLGRVLSCLHWQSESITSFRMRRYVCYIIVPAEACTGI